MDLLLTSNGITNASIEHALVELLGKEIGDSTALFVPTAIYPFHGGGHRALDAVMGTSPNPLAGLGWRSLGLLELTALPSISPDAWIPTMMETDALLVYGGNVMYLTWWLEHSGVAALIPTLEHLVYVGVSAGSIATTALNCDAASNVRVLPPDSEACSLGDRGLGWVDIGLWVHVGNPNPIFADHTMANAEAFALAHATTTYALDDESALVVRHGDVEVVSEGTWRRFDPPAT